MEGKPPVRPSDDDATPKTTGVPVAGKAGKKRSDPEPDGTPEPQPGS